MNIYVQRMKLAEELRIARLRTRLTQRELAEKLGTSKSFVYRYEIGEKRLEVAEIFIICKALGVSFYDIINSIIDDR